MKQQSQSKQVQQVKRIRDNVNGVLLIDKPAGISSNTALIQTKHLFNAKKAGHTGTLDPFATGLLPVCFGEATKFSHDLLDADKSYEAVAQLGVTTETGDTEGAVRQTTAVTATLDQINAVLKQFTGTITQVPPMYSALKRDGKPLYEYARAGVTLEREARQVVIHELCLLDYQAPLLRFHVRSSKGTYIRVLAEDIGRELGCGAHLTSLRRTQVGRLQLADSVQLDGIKQLNVDQRIELLKPVDTLLADCESIQLGDELAARFLHGQKLSLQKEPLSSFQLAAMHPGHLRVYRLSDCQFLGSGVLHEHHILVPERLVATA